MKKRFLFIISIALSLAAKSQTLVAIPDTSFRKALILQFPDCFVGNKLNIDCAGQKTGEVILDSISITSIEGIQYFSKINSLTVSGTDITSLPTLPSGLQVLNCSNNKLTSFETLLPSGLQVLYCNDNKLTSFGTLLPSGLTGLACYNNQLTSLPTLPSGLSSLTCYNNKLTSLPTLPIGLYDLTCSFNQLTSLPALPVGLFKLDCNDNSLVSLPSLPSGLSNLWCAVNKLTSLPILPTKLTSLWCAENQLTVLPTLPNGLKKLICDQNQLIELPVLPNGLTEILVSLNQLTSLPILPIELSKLVCDNNKLNSLPELPSGLLELYCGGNQLTVLPTLPAGLSRLACEGNKLTSLPALPSGLLDLYCGDNQLTSLPSLPNGLNLLYCNKNPLSCLPFLPYSLTGIFIIGLSIDCVPNKPTQLSQQLGNIPLCNPINNKSGCEFYSTISGYVFVDVNKNGIKDTNEYGRSGIKITNETSGVYTFSNDSGYYELSLIALKPYKISIAVPNYFTASIPSLTFTPTFVGEQFGQNFNLQFSKDVVDLSALLVNVTWARPGFPLVMQMEVENKGSTTENGTAYVQLPPMFTLDSTSIMSTNGLFNFQELHPGEKIKMMLYGHVSTSASLGDTLKFKGVVDALDSGKDSVVGNNTWNVNLVVRGSYDPNAKYGPGSITPGQVQNGTFMGYIVQFQNIGTDTAFTVLIADTLSQNVFPSTLEIISSSHPCKVTLDGFKLYFEFRNIRLADKKTNEPLSHGSVRYKVKPKNTLVVGNTILNKASIYFDYNKPVVTNTVTTKVSDPIITSTEANLIQSNLGSMAYPNPVEGDYLYVRDYSVSTYTLSDTQGQALMKGNVSETGINVSQLKPGVYMLETTQNQSRKVEKVVVK